MQIAAKSSPNNLSKPIEMKEYGGKAYRRQLFTRLAGAAPTYTVSSYYKGYRPASCLRLSPVEKPGQRLQTSSPKDFFMTEIGKNGLFPGKEPLHKAKFRLSDPDSSLVLSFDRTSSSSILLRLDSRGNNPLIPSDSAALKHSQRLCRGLSSRRGIHLSPNHFRSPPVPQRPVRSVCCLSVEVRPLTGSHPGLVGKEREGKEGKRERRRNERLLVAKTKEILQTELSPWYSFRLAL